MMADDVPMAADAGGDDDGDDEGDDADGVGEVEGAPGQQQPAAFGENGDGRKRRRRRGRRGRRGRREDGGTPYQSEPQSSPLGHLPTPAEALDAPDWPATGGFDTRVGAPPPPARSFDAPRREHHVEAPTMTAPPPAEEPKQERSGIASFFFGPKADESESGSESKPQRKGWWQKKTDA